MTSKQENLLDWLRDAHAMEQQAEQMLKAQAARLEHYPQLKTRIEQHIEETHGQQRLLEECLKRLDSSPSTLKDIGAKLMAFGQAVAGMTVSDEVVKGAMSGYVFENMEIAAWSCRWPSSAWRRRSIRHLPRLPPRKRKSSGRST